MLPIEALQERIGQSELGQEWINNPLLNQDIWSLEELGYSEEELKIKKMRNIYFDGFSLPWLKFLTKLTVLAISREKYSLGLIRIRVTYLRQLDVFLLSRGYGNPKDLTDNILREFVSEDCIERRQSSIVCALKLWSEEGWLKLIYTPFKIRKKVPKIETIPEETLFQIYENFDFFPPPLERLFRLQLVLGCRIGEMQRMPRQCLKQEGEQWFLLRWIEKRQHWRFYQVHPLVAELVREQQKFLDNQFGCDSDFDKLFCHIYAGRKNGGYFSRFNAEPIYVPDILSYSTINIWLRKFREKADLKDKHGNRFKLTSHHFRRTKASIMALVLHCKGG